MESERLEKGIRMSSSWFDSAYDYMFRSIHNEDVAAYPNLPLTGSLASILLLKLAYVLFVFKIGPWFMRNRKPFELKGVIMAYNALQVFLSLSLFFAAFYYLFIARYYDLGCVLKLPPNHPAKLGEVIITYTALLTRFLDYFDTIFFVLRKSYRQVTFLHVYHHLVMTGACYTYIRDYGFGGHAFASGILNVFVHTVMYSYYFLTAYRPEMKKSIWWKRHLTELQILQFLLALGHQMWPVVVRRDCPFPRHWLVVTNSQLIVFLILFGNFYKKTYSNKRITENGVANGKLAEKIT